MNNIIIPPEEYPYKHTCNGNRVIHLYDNEYCLNCSICGFVRGWLKIQAPTLGAEINIKIDKVKQYPKLSEYRDEIKNEMS